MDYAINTDFTLPHWPQLVVDSLEAGLVTCEKLRLALFYGRREYNWKINPYPIVCQLLEAGLHTIWGERPWERKTAISIVTPAYPHTPPGKPTNLCLDNVNTPFKPQWHTFFFLKLLCGNSRASFTPVYKTEFRVWTNVGPTLTKPTLSNIEFVYCHLISGRSVVNIVKLYLPEINCRYRYSSKIMLRANEGNHFSLLPDSIFTQM